MALELTSKTFEPGGAIPVRCTCEGTDLSPALAWSGLPAGTKSLALIAADPDAPDPRAPKMTWVHWVVYDLPPETTALAEGAAKGAMPSGARDGLNDWKRTAYGGPCPPIGEHRYFFELYALDTMLGDLGRPTKAQLEKAMAGHVLEKVELVGRYQKQRR
jgi:Raf kinase inhibitor-like YbhB/YbcL family protein